MFRHIKDIKIRPFLNSPLKSVIAALQTAGETIEIDQIIVRNMKQHRSSQSSRPKYSISSVHFTNRRRNEVIINCQPLYLSHSTIISSNKYSCTKNFKFCNFWSIKSTTWRNSSNIWEQKLSKVWKCNLYIHIVSYLVFHLQNSNGRDFSK